MNSLLEKEFNYYLENQDELVKKYNGRFLIIKDEKIQGDFDTQLDAYHYGKEHFELGTFLIQFCAPGNVNYTQSFHSRVSFNT
jgi:hypothetical protein